ncbi:MAG: ATP-binding protein [Acidobacteriota bacterium]
MATLLAALALLAMATWRARTVAREAAQDSTWMAHTLRVLGGIDRVMLAVTEVESFRRGYVLTKDTAYVQSGAAAEQRVQSGLADLGSLVADNSAQRQNLRDLEQAIAARLDVVRDSLRLYAQDPRNEAAQARLTRDGSAAMARVRALGASMRAIEERLLTDRAARARYSQTRSTSALALTIAIAATMLTMLLAFAWRANTRRAQSEAEVRTLNRALEARLTELDRSNRDLEQFAYVASHDLQQPVRMVASFVELLEEEQRGKLGPEGENYIRLASLNARRIQDLIQGLLTYARAGSGNNESAPVDANRSFDLAVESLKAKAVETGAEISAGSLPMVLAEEGQLSQVFENLIENAMKYRRELSPRIRIEAARDGDCWHFTVADNGLGIEARYFDRIFAIFQRLHAQSEVSGTGIGLAICKKIVERYGGALWVESELGRGSTFHFTLPALKEDVS